MEACRLRIKDIDFDRKQIIVREGKGEKDLAVPLTQRLVTNLKHQIELVTKLHQQGVLVGASGIENPLDRL